MENSSDVDSNDNETFKEEEGTTNESEPDEVPSQAINLNNPKAMKKLLQMSTPSPQELDPDEEYCFESSTLYEDKNAFISKLIEKIKENPCLYDHSTFGWRYPENKKEVWERIGKELQVEHITLEKEFKKLKDNYRKCLKRRSKAEKSKNQNKQLATCNFFEELSFLKGHFPPASDLEVRTESIQIPQPSQRQARTKTHTKKSLTSLSMKKFSIQELNPNDISQTDIALMSTNASENNVTANNPQSLTPTKIDQVGVGELETTKMITSDSSLHSTSSFDIQSGQAATQNDNTQLLNVRYFPSGKLPNGMNSTHEPPEKKHKLHNGNMTEADPNIKDTHQLFCESLVEPLRSLSPKKSKLAKMKIMQILYELEE
ncbi:uncharacterized protein [Clytia hemisphaerica]|uniref:MADF domain-containing protein n=1 Tax=Clytia hemisphaerica TaxID=252671 RepID=A0A7M5WR64_9CNID